jgi:cation-transporting ATPase 13A1
MIEFSQQSVSGNIKETGMALVLLFVFAIIASGYVLKVGLEKKEKTTHELLLKCVIIITSVVPRQFPMQVTIFYNRFISYFVHLVHLTLFDFSCLPSLYSSNVLVFDSFLISYLTIRF